ncbi:helix-turn-helix transcriptional regulator [Enterobacter vonholyi]|uniref:helix-turn-helix transcriptional regulator n=1 Tax=Enterobacter vonholyi TaxID=2797505 RepID=UPI002DBB2C3E|nr:hypothetical protein [Enterobacter vonholyi]MEB5978536.1 hypothetical protein [Enterobacter vonholyi]
MNHFIISNNSFLREGLNECLKSLNTDHFWCCIDLNYCRSLTEIYSLLTTEVINSRYRVFFIGYNSIYNELLTPLHPVRMNDSRYKIMHFFTENKGVTVDYAKEYISSLKALDLLTLNEKKLCRLLAQIDIKEVAKLECLSIKTIYGMKYKLAKKLHINNQMHFNLFLSKEINKIK